MKNFFAFLFLVTVALILMDTSILCAEKGPTAPEETASQWTAKSERITITPPPKDAVEEKISSDIVLGEISLIEMSAISMSAFDFDYAKLSICRNLQILSRQCFSVYSPYRLYSLMTFK